MICNSGLFKAENEVNRPDFTNKPAQETLFCAGMAIFLAVHDRQRPCFYAFRATCEPKLHDARIEAIRRLNLDNTSMELQQYVDGAQTIRRWSSIDVLSKPEV